MISVVLLTVWRGSVLSGWCRCLLLCVSITSWCYLSCRMLSVFYFWVHFHLACTIIRSCFEIFHPFEGVLLHGKLPEWLAVRMTWRTIVQLFFLNHTFSVIFKGGVDFAICTLMFNVLKHTLIYSFESR